MNTSFSVVICLFLWFVMIVGGTSYAVMEDWHHPLFREFWFHSMAAILGILILTLAFRAAANGGRELTKGRIGDIPRLETNALVTTGIYSCMRHPMLFGLTLLPLGWALLLGSPTFIMRIAPFEMLCIILMVIIFEEMEVAKKFAKAYEAYRQNVPMVSFSIKCLTTLFSGKKDD